MTELPNPFASAAPQVAETAVASSPTPPACDAAAEPFDHDDYSAISLPELMVRGFNVEEFLEDIEPLPLFLQAPIDVLNVLAAY